MTKHLTLDTITKGQAVTVTHETGTEHGHVESWCIDNEPRGLVLGLVHIQFEDDTNCSLPAYMVSAR